MDAAGGAVIWVTGLPAAGKSTLARGVVRALRARHAPVLWLDSDDLRAVLTPQASYSDAERDRFYGALVHLARLAAGGGVTVVVSATGGLRRYRDELRASVPAFVEIYLQCDSDLLRARDTKGLYARAAAGEVTNLPGAGGVYEPPERPELVLDSGKLTPLELVDAVMRRVDRMLCC